MRNLGRLNANEWFAVATLRVALHATTLHLAVADPLGHVSHQAPPLPPRSAAWRPGGGLRVSDRPFALDRYPVHDPAVAVIVVERIVLGAAVVPERQ